MPFGSLLFAWGGRSNSSWGFLHYFDDNYNFLENPISLWPLTASHWYEILAHRGLNVYEPIGEIFKAVQVDFVGLDPHNLRIVSLLFNTINAVLLGVWLKSTCCFKHRISSQTVIFTCLLWWMHPINAEVVGWLSAQNYIFALCFSLLATLSVEYKLNLWITIVLYALAVLSKAPAIAVVFLLTTRKFQLDKNGSLATIGLLVLTAGLLIQLVIHSNNESEQQYPETDAASYLLGAFCGPA